MALSLSRLRVTHFLSHSFYLDEIHYNSIDQNTCLEAANSIAKIFNGSVKIEETIEGRVRSNQTEHFGFKDGISQPALK